jgi:pilus assembly protein Flp/PilA
LIYSGCKIHGSIDTDMAVVTVAAKVDASILTIATGSKLMRSLSKKIVNFLKKEDGPTAVEYAVMLSLIIVVCIAAITTLGSNANNSFSYTAGKLAPTAS